MKLTVDIGNSVIGVALFKDNTIIKTFAFETRKNEQYDHYYLTLGNLLAHFDEHLVIKKAIIGSVVPSLTLILKRVLEALFATEVIVVEPGIKTGIVLKVDHPLEVGADIVACAAGAFKFGPGPFIIIDLGTANKYIYVDEKSVFHGVAISAGLKTSFDALISDADQLLSVPFFVPKNVIGKNTKDALASGALYGLLSEIEGFVSLIQKEVGQEPMILLTGGNAEYVKDIVQKDYKYEPALVHYGLLKIMEKNTYEK
ncbi:MAG: type III pantothenate kinase [Bacilli bacterium]